MIAKAKPKRKPGRPKGSTAPRTNNHANFEADEQPRCCPKCGSTKSAVKRTYPENSRTVRIRVCTDCDRRYSSIATAQAE